MDGLADMDEPGRTAINHFNVLWLEYMAMQTLAWKRYVQWIFAFGSFDLDY